MLNTYRSEVDYKDCPFGHYSDTRPSTHVTTAPFDFFELCPTCVSGRGYSAMRMAGGSRARNVPVTLVDGSETVVHHFINNGFNGITFRDAVTGDVLSAGVIAEVRA